MKLLKATISQFHFQSPQGNRGLVHWSQKELSDTYQIKLDGHGTQGNSISETIEISKEEAQEDGGINPTKVFWLIVKILKKKLCPECNNGYE